MIPSELEPLTRCRLFSGIPAEELPALLRRLGAARKRYGQDELLLTAAEAYGRVGVLLQGEVQVYRPGEDGRRVVMNRLTTGEVFGAAALFGEAESYVTEIAALRPCVVLFLSQELVTGWMRAHFPVAENYIRFLTGRIRFLNGKIAGFTGGQADERLTGYLLAHRGEDGQVTLPGSLLELAPRFIKVDISIIRGIDSDPDKQQILRNVVRYAQPRSMQIIAEGVETAAEMRTVIDLGADLLQGYFLARPAAVPDPIAPEAAEIIRAI